MKKTSLYFYNDSNIVGGHEILTARIINELVETFNYSVHFSFYCDDVIQHLSPKVNVHRIPFHSKTTAFYHQSENDIMRISRLLKRIKPKMSVISQGYIESGIRGLLASRLSGYKTGSYIPFGNTNRELNNKYATIRDVISKPIYGLNQFYITISPYQSRMLSRLVSSKPIHIINNPVAYSAISPSETCDIPLPTEHKPLNIAVVGRILFKQKNQNCLPYVAKKLIEQQSHVKFHIVGDGPDRANLEHLIQRTNTTSMFEFYDWMNKTELSQLMNSTIDAVLVPSHYEGLPLVFLESIFHGKPVLISNMPFIEDYPIPQAYVVDANTPDSIVSAITNLPHQTVALDTQNLQRQIQTSNSFERFQIDIESCFKQLIS